MSRRVVVDASGPEDEGGVPPAGGPLSDLPGEWGRLVIPDDVSALAAEIAAVRAQLGRERRRQWAARLVPRWLWSGVRTPLVGVLLLVAASFTSLFVVVLPAGAPLARAVPLARSTSLAGHDGGLLPDVQLLDALGSPFPMRDVRPGVVLLVGDGCACGDLVTEYVRATAEARMRLLVVGDEVAPALPSEALRGRVMAASDPTRRLASALVPPRGGGPAAVFVRADGVIYRISPDARDVVPLRSELAALS
ncbi:MAG TPA: hypothetical protein VGD72_10815 [Mycobacteriales bacterium]